MPGTVYALIDPRDGTTRYIGQTKKTPLAERLKGGYAPRVRAWIAELRTAGLAPLITPVRENVPVEQLLTAEREEITRVLVDGGTLLNELSTAEGREILRLLREAERITAEQAAWRELAGIALDLLGGPLPPGDLPELVIPDPEDRRRSVLRSMGIPDAELILYRLSPEREEEEFVQQMQSVVRGAWSDACRTGSDRFVKDLDLNVSVVAPMPHASHAELSRHLGLTVWYMVAVHPWRHLAELAGLAPDDETFISWAGQDAGVREALEFLAAHREKALERIPHRYYGPHERGPGHTLATVAAAYSGAAPEAIRRHLAGVLSEMADDHQLTQPMADLLLRLNPEALDSVFGPDIAAKMDRELDLTAGTSGRVLQALGRHITRINDPQVRRAIDRSTHAFRLRPLPDYGGWYGPGILAARIVSASLVRAGLAVPDRVSAEEYLAEVCALWAPLPDDQRRQEAA